MSVRTINLGSDSGSPSPSLPAPSRRSSSPRGRTNMSTRPSVVRTAPSMRASPDEMRRYTSPSPRRSVQAAEVETHPGQFKPSDHELRSCDPCGEDACAKPASAAAGCSAAASVPLVTATTAPGCYTGHLTNAWFWGFLIAAILAIILIWIFAAGGWGRVTSGSNGAWLWGIVGVILLVLFAISAYQAFIWGNRNQRIMIGIAYLLALVVGVVLYAVFFSGDGSGAGSTMAAFWLSILLLAILIWLLWLVWGHAFATWIVVLLLIFVIIQTIWLWSVYAN